MKKFLILFSLLALPNLKAQEMKITLPQETARFKQGPSVQLVNGQCLVCHSADYISMQPPKGLDFWQGEVTKMKDKYGAPIPTNQINDLAVYLAATYGTGVPNPVTPTVTQTNATGTIDPAALAQQSGCLNCHAPSAKVGPAYKLVAAKYHDRADAMDRVSHQITHGGFGQWGQIPMPPFPQFTPEQVSALAHWVLDQK